MMLIVRSSVRVLLLAVVVVTQATAAELVTIKVEGLACPFCAYGIEKHLKKLDAVASVDELVSSVVLALVWAVVDRSQSPTDTRALSRPP